MIDSKPEAASGAQSGGSCEVRAERASLPFDAVALAASAGGLPALRQLLAALPADFPVPILVAQHLRRGRPSLMASILNRQTALVVKQAEEGELALPGQVYLAPPDLHLRVGRDQSLRLAAEDPVNSCRPSADVLFNSVASSYGSRGVGVVLTGAGRDGSAGLARIRGAGGVTIAQDAATAALFPMPRAAIETGCVDFVLPLDRIAAALIALTMVRGADLLFRTSREGSAPHYQACQRSVCLRPKPSGSVPSAHGPFTIEAGVGQALSPTWSEELGARPTRFPRKRPPSSCSGPA